MSRYHTCSVNNSNAYIPGVHRVSSRSTAVAFRRSLKSGG